MGTTCCYSRNQTCKEAPWPACPVLAWWSDGSQLTQACRPRWAREHLSPPILPARSWRWAQTPVPRVSAASHTPRDPAVFLLVFGHPPSCRQAPLMLKRVKPSPLRSSSARPPKVDRVHVRPPHRSHPVTGTHKEGRKLKKKTSGKAVWAEQSGGLKAGEPCGDRLLVALDPAFRTDYSP